MEAIACGEFASLGSFSSKSYRARSISSRAPLTIHRLEIKFGHEFDAAWGGKRGLKPKASPTAFERVIAHTRRKSNPAQSSSPAVEDDVTSAKKSSSHWPSIPGAENPLTSEEEQFLAAEVQDLLHLEHQRDELEQKLGRTPHIEEWAEYSGISTFRLYARIGKGRAAKRKMVAANLRLVHSVAGQFHGKGLSHTELCQEGVLGLLKSTEKFDTSHKTKFSSYSFLWIWEGMSAAVKKFRHVLRISRTVYATASLVLRHKEEFQSMHGREPTLQELSDSSLVDKDTIKNTIRLVRPVQSLERLVSTLDGEYERQVGDPNGSGLPWVRIRENQLKMDISNALQSLTSREQDVLQMRYGLNGKPPLSRAEVASLMSLTYESIRLTEKKALDKLRQLAKEDGLQEYLSRSFWDH